MEEIQSYLMSRDPRDPEPTYTQADLEKARNDYSNLIRAAKRTFREENPVAAMKAYGTYKPPTTGQVKYAPGDSMFKFFISFQLWNTFNSFLKSFWSPNICKQIVFANI